jgi:hypothetical protein
MKYSDADNDMLDDWRSFFPKALLWDYKYPPNKEWALQRIAEFFPVYGHDYHVVNALYGHLKHLNIPDDTREAIKLYYRIWQEEIHGKTT